MQRSCCVGQHLQPGTPVSVIGDSANERAYYWVLSHSLFLTLSIYPSIYPSTHLSISPSASFAFFLHLLTAFFRIFRLFFFFFFLLIQPLFEFFDADVGPVGHLMSSNTICLAGMSGLLEWRICCCSRGASPTGPPFTTSYPPVSLPTIAYLLPIIVQVCAYL